MRYEVIFREAARDEALDAADFIAQRTSQEAALRWYEGLTEAVRSLSVMPARCGFARENGRFPGRELRQLLYHSHRLIFTIEGRSVHVLHVRHTASASLDALESE